MGPRISRFNQIVFLILLILSAALAQQIDPPTPTPEEAATVTLRAVDGQTNVPIPNVKLELRRAPVVDSFQQGQRPDMRSWSYFVTTGEDGTATVEIMPNRYTSYTPEENYGLASGTDRTVTIPPGEKVEFTVRLWRASRVSGIVEDADGNPIPKVAVELMSESWQGGMRGLTTRTLPVIRTDENGAFSYSGVLPGRYYLRATQANLTPEMMRAGTWHQANPLGDTYYPSSVDLERAAPINVLAGVDQSGLRISMLEGRYYTVRGTVEGLPRDPGHVGVSLFPLTDRNSDLRRFSFPGLEEIGATVQPDGSFEIADIAPGPYLAELGGAVRGRKKLLVEDEDILDVEIPVALTWTFAGRMVFEDGTPSEAWQAFLDTFLPGTGEKGVLIQVSPEGTFAVPELEPGRYRLDTFMHPEILIKSIEINGTTYDGSLMDFGAPGTEDAVITLTRTGPSLAGAVEWVDRDSKAGTVTLMPEPKLPMDRSRTAVLNARGEFSYPLIEAGTYRACAWNTDATNVNNILNDPRFEPKLKSGCKTVTLDGEDGEQVQLKQLDVATFQ